MKNIDKKALYESIMTRVAKIVKEDLSDFDGDDEDIMSGMDDLESAAYDGSPIIIVDNSGSMWYRNSKGEIDYERAIIRAMRLLHTDGPVWIYTYTTELSDEGMRINRLRDFNARAFQKMMANDKTGGTDMIQAVKQAIKMAGNPGKVCVISDGEDFGWDDVQDMGARIIQL